MELATILARLDHERRTLAPGGATIERLPHVTRLTSDEGQHSIVYTSLPPQKAEEAIAEQMAHYRAVGKAFEWKVYRHDEPLDLKARLASRGFLIGPMEAVLVLDLAEAPGWIDTTDTSAVMRVESLGQLPLYRQAAEAIFGNDCSFTIAELARGIHEGSTDQRGYIASDAEQPVSVARLYTHRDSHFGGLYGGGTIATHRGRGFYRQLIAARARDARALGAQYLIVDALPTSRPILERLGFVHLTDTWPCECSP